MFDLQAKFGVTMVLVTHDPALADRCDRTIRLSDGSLMQEDAA
jgi:putative ABC transport system ATP-binding protein